ncbi:MAG: hypothetical protein WAX04_11665, partial [Oscillospiraceae bacterium]
MNKNKLSVAVSMALIIMSTEAHAGFISNLFDFLKFTDGHHHHTQPIKPPVSKPPVNNPSPTVPSEPTVPNIPAYTPSSTPLTTDTYAPWLNQIGLSNEISSAGKWGKDIKVAIVDTGIIANSGLFAAGQVSDSLSSCARVTSTCVNGYYDSIPSNMSGGVFGHGTKVSGLILGTE